MEGSRQRSGRSLLPAWPLALILALLSALVALPWIGGDAERETEAIVARMLAQDVAQEARTIRTLRTLASFGPRGIEVMFAALVHDSVPLGTQEAPGLSESQRALLRRALSSMEAQPLRSVLSGALEQERDPRAAIEALAVLGPCARREDLRFMLEAAVRGLELGGALEHVQPALEEALSGPLAREPRAFAELPQLWRRSSPELQPAIVNAVAAAGSPAGLPFLAGLLGRSDELDEVVLAAMLSLAQGATPPVSEEVAGPLHRMIERGSAARIQSAAITLGRLQDEEAIPLLIDSLEHESRGVQNQAARALERITGLSFRNEPTRWRAWYEQELGWFEEHGERSLEALLSERSEEVFEAVRTLAKRKLFRHQTADQLAPLLEHESHSIRRVVPHALAQLGSTVALPVLIDSLLDADEETARSSWNALKSLTGLELPFDHEAWCDFAPR